MFPSGRMVLECSHVVWLQALGSIRSRPVFNQEVAMHTKVTNERRSGVAGVVLAIVVATAMVSGMSVARAADDPMSRVVAANGAAGEVQIDAVVAAVDKTNRVLTLRDKKGGLHDVVVPEEVKAFDKVKKGDQLVINYRLGVAIALLKNGKGQRELAQSEASAPLSNYEVGRQISQRTTIAAAVEAWNPETNIATLRGPKGRVVDVKVEDPTVIKTLKKGDQVVTVISQSLAVALWPKAEADAARKAMAK
jgi:hypothetical protein